MTRIVVAILVSLGLASSASGASVDGVDIFSLTEGEGPAIVFVHGWTCDTTVWADQIEAFSDEYQVVALDLPGHGRSGAPENEAFTLDLYTGAIEAVVTEMDLDRLVLVGHSMGVPVISHYAARYADRVVGLVAVDGPISAPPSPDGGQAPPPVLNGVSREESIRSFFVPQTPEPLRRQILDLMLEPSDERAAAILAPFFDPSFSFADPPAVPTLNVVAGNQAPLDPDAMRASPSNTQFVQMEGTGHFLMMEQPEQFNDIVSAFLEGLEL